MSKANKMGRATTPQHIIRQMFILHSENMSFNKIGTRLKIAPNTVRKHLNDKANIAQYGDLLHTIEEINQKSNKDVIDMIKSERYSNIANDVISLLTTDNLKTEFEKSGIRNLISLLGNTVDKTLALKRHEIKEKEYGLQERTLAIKERELELKEKELDLRVNKPESFKPTINIINDAPKHEIPNYMDMENDTDATS